MVETSSLPPWPPEQDAEVRKILRDHGYPPGINGGPWAIAIKVWKLARAPRVTHPATTSGCPHNPPCPACVFWPMGVPVPDPDRSEVGGENDVPSDPSWRAGYAHGWESRGAESDRMNACCRTCCDGCTDDGYCCRHSYAGGVDAERQRTRGVLLSDEVADEIGAANGQWLADLLGSAQ